VGKSAVPVFLQKKPLRGSPDERQGSQLSAFCDPFLPLPGERIFDAGRKTGDGHGKKEPGRIQINSKKRTGQPGAKTEGDAAG